MGARKQNNNRYESGKRPKGKGNNPAATTAGGTSKAALNDQLDEALKETFPASDAVAAVSTLRPGSSHPNVVGEPMQPPEPVKEAKNKDELDALLDEALQESFPASDPVSLVSRLKPGKRRKSHPGTQ